MFWHFDIRLGIVVVVLALIQGGRWERLVALLMTVRGVLNLMAPKWDWMDANDWRRLMAFQGVFLLIFLWLLWRHRRPWLLAFVLLQAGSVLLEGWCSFHLSTRTETAYTAIFFALAIAKSLVLGWAVLRRWITPPRPLPGQDDPDLYAVAASRGFLPREAPRPLP
jgi:drug/metabolite transporter (DMT)-like permease